MMAEQSEAAAYIHDLAYELALIATRHGLQDLAYLLKMVAIEAAGTRDRDRRAA